jgi:hypothetical protein
MELFEILSWPLQFFAMFGGTDIAGAAWASTKCENSERAARQQSEIERKLAIAEAARASRARGETFIPPADYDR